MTIVEDTGKITTQGTSIAINSSSDFLPQDGNIKYEIQNITMLGMDMAKAIESTSSTVPSSITGSGDHHHNAIMVDASGTTLVLEPEVNLDTSTLMGDSHIVQHSADLGDNKEQSFLANEGTSGQSFVYITTR